MTDHESRRYGGVEALAKTCENQRTELHHLNVAHKCEIALSQHRFFALQKAAARIAELEAQVEEDRKQLEAALRDK